MAITSINPNGSTLLLIPRGPQGPAADESGSTDLTVTRTATKVTVNSSSGADAGIAAADTSNAGVMTAADRATLSGLGTASTKNAPASGNAASGEVVLGADTRLADARTPTAHAATHAPGGTDPIPAFTGATALAAGGPGVVPAPGPGQQGLFLRGDASWAAAAGSGGGALTSFSFRDANLTGFTGAKWEFVQKAGQSNDAFGSVSQAQFPIASGEIVLIRFDFIMTLPDFSKCHVGGGAAAFKKVGSTLTTIDQLSGLSGDQTQDFASSSGLDARVKSLTSSTIDFLVTSDSTNTNVVYNWFANFRILRMITNT